MFFNKKKVKNNWVLKLYKVTDKESVIDFRTEDFIVNILQLICNNTKFTPIDFDINNESNYKTIGGFQKAASAINKIAFCSVGLKFNEFEANLILSNCWWCYSTKPDNSYIEIILQLPCELITKDSMIRISGSIIKMTDVDYGYIVNLPENYDIVSERKLKHSFFSVSSEVTRDDFVWNSHLCAILDGYIKNLHPINFLNQNQLNKIKKEIDIKSLNKEDELYLLFLKEEEIENLEKKTSIGKCLISKDFLKNVESKKYYEKMKVL